MRFLAVFIVWAALAYTGLFVAAPYTWADRLGVQDDITRIAERIVGESR